MTASERGRGRGSSATVKAEAKPSRSLALPLVLVAIHLSSATGGLATGSDSEGPHGRRVLQDPGAAANTNSSQGQLWYDRCPQSRDDFLLWRKIGIHSSTVGRALRNGGWRYKFIDGTFYVGNDHYLIQDFTHTKRDAFIQLGLLRLAQKYGRELPNVEFVLANHDWPKVESAGRKPPQYYYKEVKRGKPKTFTGRDPPLMFGSYVSMHQKTAWDIGWPQYTFWGELLCKRPSDPPWKQLREELMASWRPFHERNASVLWSGQPNNPLRFQALKCDKPNFLINNPGARAWGAGRCKYKYLLYIDGKFASSSSLPIFGCGSVMLMVRSHWTSLLTRCLEPYKHYLPITNDPKQLCNDISEKIAWAEANPEKAEAIAREAQDYVRHALSMDSVYDMMKRRLEDYRKIMKYSPAVRKGSDTPIRSFEELTAFVDSTTAKYNRGERGVLMARWVDFNKGNMCCCDCPGKPQFAHLCPGRDQGWLEP